MDDMETRSIFQNYNKLDQADTSSSYGVLGQDIMEEIGIDCQSTFGFPPPINNNLALQCDLPWTLTMSGHVNGSTHAAKLK